jgi:hypothetical protein
MVLGSTVLMSSFPVMIRRRFFDLEARQKNVDTSLLKLLSTEASAGR